jgi:hypothetical protein
MLKSKILLGGCVLAALAILVYLFAASKAVGNMSDRCDAPATTTSTLSFPGENGDRFRFVFESQVESGDLDIVLYDSAGNKVDAEALDFDRAKELKAYFTLERSDTYTLAAERRDFVGSFSIKLYRTQDRRESVL